MMLRFLAALALVLPAVSPALAQTAPSGARPAVAPNTYRISPGDQIDVFVWGEDRLARSLLVLPDGSFAFPLAGTIQAAGKTPVAVEGELSRLLAPQFKGIAPQVTVSVKAPTGLQVSVIGKVRAPGTFSPTHYVTVLDALAQAGGPSDFADVSSIVILRNGGDGKTNIIHVRLDNVLRGKPSANDLSPANIPQLIAGDTVVVP